MKSVLSMAADILDPPGDRWRPLRHQIPPPGDWFIWLLLAGRGSGKTEAAGRYFHDHIHGPPCDPRIPGGHWPAIIAPTLGDGVTSCVNGPSGLRKYDSTVKVTQTVGGAMVRWGNGVEAKIFGAHTPEDVERLRSGGNRCLVWAEEAAAWRYLDECWKHMRYGLRLGPRPHAIVSTTPKNRKIVKDLIIAAKRGVATEDMGLVVMTKATTKDNPHLPQHISRMLFADYGGTRLGRQELYAEVIEDVEGALWTTGMIDPFRLDLSRQPKKYDMTIVSVDPPAKATGAECGIIVQSKMRIWHPTLHDPERKLAHAFVRDDRSRQGSPNEWGLAAVNAYHDWDCELMIVETNNGGDMVKNTVRNIDAGVRIHEVHASKGKKRRAEPVVNIYEQDRYHHVGVFPQLEDQMTTWNDDDPPDHWDWIPGSEGGETSPDRLDALVWGGHYMMIGNTQSRQSRPGDNRLKGRR